MAGGVNPTMVLSPMFITTDSELQITLNDVRLVTEYEEEGICP